VGGHNGASSLPENAPSPLGELPDTGLHRFGIFGRPRAVKQLALKQCAVNKDDQIEGCEAGYRRSAYLRLMMTLFKTGNDF
jgi:hypothetical protein